MYLNNYVMLGLILHCVSADSVVILHRGGGLNIRIPYHIIQCTKTLVLFPFLHTRYSICIFRLPLFLY